MKQITKSSSPQYFEAWKTRNNTANWAAFSQSANSTIKVRLSNDLLNDQGNICCYCEREISSTNSHIEHIKPKSTYPNETFIYSNLLSSCQDKNTCGHKKDNNFFIGFVSPLYPNCQSRFTYTESGEIIPKDPNDNDAIKTIELLNLSDPKGKLNNMRKTVIKSIIESKKNLPQNNYNNFINYYLNQNFCKFYTAVIYADTQPV